MMMMVAMMMVVMPVMVPRRPEALLAVMPAAVPEMRADPTHLVDHGGLFDGGTQAGCGCHRVGGLRQHARRDDGRGGSKREVKLTHRDLLEILYFGGGPT